MAQQKSIRNEHMSFEFLETLRKNNPAWRLMASPQAPFVIAFLYNEFIADNRRHIAEQELIGSLENFKYVINKGRAEEIFPRSGREYLDEWANNSHGWLRKFYPVGQDEPHFDITSLAQKAIEWLHSLKPQAFIGTESRLITVFELLRQIVAGSETDPKQRYAELQRQKDEIEQEMQRVEKGEITLLNDTQIKERFWQAMSTAREILADFREVERNFRCLDRNLRERIATWDKGKGELLEAIFTEQDGISNSEQGKSFSAFWSFLMSSTSQERFSDTLERVLQLEPVKEMGTGQYNRSIQYDWIQAGEYVQQTVATLSHQLRRYVDETFLEEERRINQILRSIEGKAISIRNNPPKEWKIDIDGINPDIILPMDKPLFTPTQRPKIQDDNVNMGNEDIPMESLYSQIYVDKEALKDKITYLLRTRERITLSQIIDIYPLELGLSELVTYLVIASENTQAAFQAEGEEKIYWDDEDGTSRFASIPMIIFNRSKGGMV